MNEPNATQQPRLWGTTIDLVSPLRDSVLAGGYVAIVALAALKIWLALPIGYAGGAFVGAVLHILPSVPLPDDSRNGRIAVRSVAGLIAGAGTAPTLVWLIDGSHAVDRLAEAAALGALAGLAWYFAWGLWETRNLERSA